MAIGRWVGKKAIVVDMIVGITHVASRVGSWMGQKEESRKMMGAQRRSGEEV